MTVRLLGFPEVQGARGVEAFENPQRIPVSTATLKPIV